MLHVQSLVIDETWALAATSPTPQHSHPTTDTATLGGLWSSSARGMLMRGGGGTKGLGFSTKAQPQWVGASQACLFTRRDREVTAARNYHLPSVNTDGGLFLRQKSILPGTTARMTGWRLFLFVGEAEGEGLFTSTKNELNGVFSRGQIQRLESLGRESLAPWETGTNAQPGSRAP